MSNRMILTFIIASLLRLSRQHQEPISHTNGEECGAHTRLDEPWYWAYNSYPAIEFQVIDWGYLDAEDLFGIGGKSRNPSALNKLDCNGRSEAAVIMMYSSKEASEPDELRVVCDVTTAQGQQV